jgi:hypothetical protein
VTLDGGQFTAGTTAMNTDANGAATFTNLVVDVPGTYVLIASAGAGAGLDSAVSAPFEIGATNLITERGRALAAMLDSLEVEVYWKRGVSVNWLTGAEGGFGPNMTVGTASHCSSFAPAVAQLLGVYLLTQSATVSDLGLANRQADWLRTNLNSGWFEVASHAAAQHIANTGGLVMATLKEDSVSGHIAVVRPSIKSDAEVSVFGPQICQSGMTNHNDIDLRTGFNVHADPMLRVLYYSHDYTDAPSRVAPFFISNVMSNGVYRTEAVSIVGRKYTWQWTSNLMIWSDAVPFTNSNNSTEFYCVRTLSDPAAGASSRRFYRLLAR